VAPVASQKAPAVTVSKPAPAPKQTKLQKKAVSKATKDDDLDTFLALPSLILFWVITYAVINEEEED
jgi:hypothetical protein